MVSICLRRWTKFKHGFNGGHGFGFFTDFFVGCEWVLDYLGDFFGFASAGALPYPC